jgi:hypothetical protein
VTEPQQHEVNMNLQVSRKPRPQRRHPILDIFALLFSAALISTVFKSAVVFAVVAAIAIALYVFQAATANSRATEARLTSVRRTHPTGSRRDQAFVVGGTRSERPGFVQ